MRDVTVSQPKDNEEECPTCGGVLQRRPYGEMYAGSFIRDGERVEIRLRPDAEYRDPIFLDPLTWYFNGGLYRLWPSQRYHARGGKVIHRAVWESAFGSIPDGCHIHHRDNDVSNPRLVNLECIPAQEHLSLRGHGNRRERYFTSEAREKAAEWHRSEAGILWHRRQAERSQSWTKWKRSPRPCEQCDKVFDALVRANGFAQKFCSEVCKAANYRARKAIS